jgi:hypothetical protein
MKFETVNVSLTTLETLIEGLESAVNVCYNVDGSSKDCEKSYPYAVGYCRRALELTVQNLKHIKSQAN